MENLSALSGLARNTVLTYVALSLSAVALIVSLLNVLAMFAGRWGRKPLEPSAPPCDTSPTWKTSWYPPKRTAPPSDPNADIVAGLQEWPEWSVEPEKRFRRPEQRLPGDPSFRIK